MARTSTEASDTHGSQRSLPQLHGPHGGRADQPRGARGKRFALPNAKIMIHQGSAGFQGTPADIEIHAKEVLSLRRRMAEILAHHCGQSVEQVEHDIDRDRFMTPEESKEYGLIDEIISSRSAAMVAPGALASGAAGLTDGSGQASPAAQESQE